MTTVTRTQPTARFVPWIFYQTLVQRRRTLIYWMLAMGGLAFYTASFYPTLVAGNEALDQLVAQLPPYLEAVLGQVAGFTSPEGYLDSKLYLLFAPFVLMVYTIRFGISIIAGEEQAKTIDLLLANPVTRTRVVLEKYAAMLVATALIVAATGLGVWLAAVVYGFGVNTAGLVAVNVHLWFLLVALGTLAMLVANATASGILAGTVAGAVAVISYFINSFAVLSKTAERLRPLSLFYYYRGHNPFFEGLHWGDLAVLGLFTLVCLVLGVAAVNRRDLGT